MKPSKPPTSTPLAEPIYDEPPAELVQRHRVPSVAQAAQKEAIYDEPQSAAVNTPTPSLASSNPPVQYRARYSFTAGAESEISFHQGDLLYTATTGCGEQEEGWTMVRGGEVQGWAPAEYLEPVDSNSEGE